jgi:hypothetical protein
LSSGHFDDHRIAAFLPFAHRPSGSLLASASDLGKLVDFWARRGEGYPPIVSAAGLARIERNGTLPYRPLASDYGLANYGDVSYSVLGRGHDGGMPGFHATIRYYPELRIGFAMLLNANCTFRGYREIRALLYAYLTRDRELPPRRSLPSPVDKPTADFYALAAPRAAVFAFIDTAIIGSHVVDAGDRLHVTELFDSSHYDLVPSTDGAYAYAGDHGSSVRFTTDRHGTPVMVTGFSYGEAAPWWLARLRYSLLAAAMLLMKLAPIVAIGLLLFSAIERRRILPLALVLWPALAALCCPAIPHLLETAFLAGVVGTVHPLTVAVCALTIGFAVATVASLVCVTRWAFRPDRPHLLALVFPAMCGLAFTGLTVWLGLHGMIGFRTWAW